MYPPQLYVSTPTLCIHPNCMYPPQLYVCSLQESKRSFLHSVVNEGGDKEKLESFVNFCEDTIFEVI